MKGLTSEEMLEFDLLQAGGLVSYKIRQIGVDVGVDVGAQIDRKQHELGDKTVVLGRVAHFNRQIYAGLDCCQLADCET